MDEFSTEAISTPGQRPVRVVFLPIDAATFTAEVRDVHDDFIVKGFPAVDVTRAQFDALPFDPRDPSVFGAASLALFK